MSDSFSAVRLSWFDCQRFITDTRPHCPIQTEQYGLCPCVGRIDFSFAYRPKIRSKKTQISVFSIKISLCVSQCESQCLHPTFHCPGKDADRLAGARCSGNTCVVQDSLPLPHFIVYVPTLISIASFESA